MEQTKTPLFDATKPFVVPILSGGEKRCEVRFPSDEEWCGWARAQRTVRHFLGRGKSQSEDVDLPKINAELFAKIRTDKDGPEFDDAEAGMVIGRIERCAVASVEREGINYRIGMKVPGARVTHVLRMPTAKEMQDHERASTSVVAARRSVETRAFLEPSGALYDKLHVSHESGRAVPNPVGVTPGNALRAGARVPGPGVPLPEVRLFGADGIGRMPGMRRRLEGHRCQPRSSLPQEPAR